MYTVDKLIRVSIDEDQLRSIISKHSPNIFGGYELKRIGTTIKINIEDGVSRRELYNELTQKFRKIPTADDVYRVLGKAIGSEDATAFREHMGREFEKLNTLRTVLGAPLPEDYDILDISVVDDDIVLRFRCDELIWV